MEKVFQNILSVCKDEASLILYLYSLTSKSFESTVGAPAAMCSLPALFSQFQCVLQPTGALQYVGISRIAIAFTAHLDVTKSVCIVHIGLTLPL